MSRTKPKRNSVVRTLEDLGLSENEAILYSQMLSYPQSTVQELVNRSPFPRTMLYHVLKQLIVRGLVSGTRETRRTTYVVENPERLYDLLSHKEKEFSHGTNTIRELIPQLKLQYRLAGKRPTVRTFDGLSEYQKVLGDSILSGAGEMYSYETLEKKPALEVRSVHDRQRVARKIQKKVLFFDQGNSREYLANRGYDDCTQFRSLNEASVTPFSTDLCLYAGKILYTSYYDEREPVAILVEDESLYLMQKNMFLSLWKQGKDCTLSFIKTS